MPPDQTSVDDLVMHLKALMPTSPPAWLQQLGQYLVAHWPDIAALILKLLPGSLTSQQQTALACCCSMYEASQDTGLKGPMTDPFVKSVLDAFNAFLKGPNGLDALEAYAVQAISKITP